MSADPAASVEGEDEELGWSEEGTREAVSKLRDFQAFAERPNPPNTEFRR